jgi:methionyl-tRNA synthetase
MREAFTLPGDNARWVTGERAHALDFVPAGTPFTVPPVLFAKITDEDLGSFRERFGGSQNAG